MMKAFTAAPVVFLALLTASCGYRFVDPAPGEGYVLIDVRNVTPEPGLHSILARDLSDLGSFDPEAEYGLRVVVTRFAETVDSVSSGGITVRQGLKLEVEWRVQGSDNSAVESGMETATGTYLYSDDPTVLDWNRSAAISALSRAAAQRILERLEDLL
jgi:hypothetical protein